MTRQELYQLFLESFPLESLRTLPLERYTNLNRNDSFCYWVESKTYNLGSIWGGSSYKFGIYKYANKPNEKDPRVVSDDAYAWYAKYGKETATDAYDLVRNSIADIAEAARAGELEKIDSNDILGEGIKWKIAFLYSNLQLVPFYKKDMLVTVAKGMGMESAAKSSIPEIQRYLMSKKDESTELFDYYDSMFPFLEATTPIGSKEIFEAIRTALAEDSRFITGKSGRDYLWIGTRDKSIGNSKCHYEVVTGKSKKAEHLEKTVYVELHFEDNEASRFRSLASLPGLREFKWDKLGIRAVESGISTVGTNAPDLAEALIEQLRDLDDIAGHAISEILGHETHYWMYSPGDAACAWDDCLEKDIMVLGWDELGDFSQFTDKESLRNAIQEAYGGEGSHKNDVLAVWQFKNEIHTGDIVYAKRGRYTIIGRGVVSSEEYTYDENREEYMSIRYIHWTHSGEWELPDSAAMKTLTDITSYTDYIKTLEDMILGNAEKKDAMGTKYTKYIELLKACRNLILTGAPGTGKTYLAKAIAGEMGAETDFVQFHPSYDYTDFVEGLRPSGNGTFERRDGIFKEFCKAALKNLEDSKKTQKVLAEEKNIDERIDAFLASAVENQTLMELKSGNKFTVTEYTDKVIRVESKDNEKTPRIDIKMSEVRELLEKNVQLDNVHDIRDHFGRKFGTQQDSYTFVITCAIKAMKTISVAPINKVERKNFVFIIDEINRGEMSKILGELFFSIDPGYRGEKGRVKTQYQNLIEDDDDFAKGFFIPENVYIIGTMNDIDRSVESMDFAVRRRFTWKEVLPEERLDMWDDCTGSWKEVAEQRMSSLNSKISDGSVGLSREYSIGPAYFRNLDNYNGDFDKLWSMHLEPLLREYLRGSRGIAESLKKLENAYNLIDEPEQDSIDL